MGKTLQRDDLDKLLCSFAPRNSLLLLQVKETNRDLVPSGMCGVAMKRRRKTTKRPNTESHASGIKEEEWKWNRPDKSLIPQVNCGQQVEIYVRRYKGCGRRIMTVHLRETRYEKASISYIHSSPVEHVESIRCLGNQHAKLTSQELGADRPATTRVALELCAHEDERSGRIANLRIYDPEW